MRRAGLRSCLLAALLCGLLLVMASQARAQATDQAPPAPRLPAPDFLLERPIGSIGLRGGWVIARAGSDVFDFLHERLTIDKSDFNAPAIAADLALAVTSRVDAGFGLEFARTTMRSEYRDLVDNNFLPIEQTTALSTMHLIGELRYAFVPRGYAVSRLAWVPRRVVPFAGLGAGAVHYELTQSGDFVDYVDNSVFTDNFRSAGWAPTAHAFGGVELHVHRRLFATIDARHVWADASLDQTFEGFEPVDLAGFRTAFGVNFIF
jgi:hypothetical protein